MSTKIKRLIWPALSLNIDAAILELESPAPAWIDFEPSGQKSTKEATAIGWHNRLVTTRKCGVKNGNSHCDINGGFSGGAIVDTNSRLIGMIGSFNENTQPISVLWEDVNEIWDAFGDVRKWLDRPVPDSAPGLMRFRKVLPNDKVSCKHRATGTQYACQPWFRDRCEMPAMWPGKLDCVLDDGWRVTRAASVDYSLSATLEVAQLVEQLDSEAMVSISDPFDGGPCGGSKVDKAIGNGCFCGVARFTAEIGGDPKPKMTGNLRIPSRKMDPAWITRRGGTKSLLEAVGIGRRWLSGGARPDEGDSDSNDVIIYARGLSAESRVDCANVHNQKRLRIDLGKRCEKNAAEVIMGTTRQPENVDCSIL